MRSARTPLAIAATVAVSAMLAVPASASTSRASRDAAVDSASSALTLDVTGGQPPATRDFNPFVPTSTIVGWSAVGYVYEPLLQFDDLKPGTVYPWLATKATWSNDYKTITFQLRKGVKWSDGVPFTSADVVYTFETMKKYPQLDYNGTQFNTIKAEGPYTVVMTFAKPSYTQEPTFAGATYIVPAHIWSKVKDPVSFENPDPVGTGPFEIQSVTPDYLYLSKNPNYWQKGKPIVQAIRLVGADSGTTMDLYIDKGLLDWGGAFVQDIQKVFVARDPKYNHYWFPHLQITALFTNLKTWPLSDLAVRKAISLAINRPLISKEGEENYQPAVKTETGLILPYYKNYLPKQYANDNYKYDPAAAKKLLEADGFKMGKNGYFQKDGKTLGFTIIEPSGYTDYVADDEIMVNELKQAGMDVSFQGLSQNAWNADLADGDFQASMKWSGLGTTPFYSLQSFLDYTLSAPIGKVASYDYERWDNAKTQSYITQYETAPSAVGRLKAIIGLEGIMMNDLPVIPIFYTANWGEYRTNKFVGWPTPSNPYEPISPDNPNSAEVVVLHLRPAS